MEIERSESPNDFPKSDRHPDTKRNAARCNKGIKKDKNVGFVFNVEAGEKVDGYPVAERLRRHRERAIKMPVPDSTIKNRNSDKPGKQAKNFEAGFHRPTVTFP